MPCSLRLWFYSWAFFLWKMPMSCWRCCRVWWIWVIGSHFLARICAGSNCRALCSEFVLSDWCFWVVQWRFCALRRPRRRIFWSWARWYWCCFIDFPSFPSLCWAPVCTYSLTISVTFPSRRASCGCGSRFSQFPSRFLSSITYSLPSGSLSSPTAMRSFRDCRSFPGRVRGWFWFGWGTFRWPAVLSWCAGWWDWAVGSFKICLPTASARGFLRRGPSAASR